LKKPSPQLPLLGYQFVPIPNEIVETLALTYLSPTESRIIRFIERKTYGYGKPEGDRIAMSQFEIGTELDRWHIQPSLQDLIQRHIVIRSGNGYALSYALNLNVIEWERKGSSNRGRHNPKSLLKQVTNPESEIVTQTEEIVTQTGNEIVTQTGNYNRQYTNTIDKKKGIVTDLSNKFKEIVKLTFSELSVQHPLLNVVEEEMKFWEFWGDKNLKKPRGAVINWLKKAERINIEEGKNGARPNFTRPATHKRSLPQRTAYPTPEEVRQHVLHRS
jgi:phage replication O-like protein O